jgi:hypothetical protein
VKKNAVLLIAGLLIPCSTLILACQPSMPAPASPAAAQVGYVTRSVVIYAGAPANPAPWGGGSAYGAANNPSGPPNEHEIDMEVPGSGTLLATWYTLEDRVDQLSQFAYIDVGKADRTHVKLKLSSQAGSTSFLRIRIHALYTR